MAQRWHDLLFAHWPLPREKMRELVPRELELDCFEGQSWIGIVPFRMSGVRLKGTPSVPGLSAFPELNVRTYVKLEGKPGVWFFSLDAANRVAVEVARAWFHLPYFSAAMAAACEEREIAYRSLRTDRRGRGARLVARYAPAGDGFLAKTGTLEHFLTERYCLYAQRRQGRLLRAEIHHAPWRLQNASATFEENTMTAGLGVELKGAPLLHFSKLQEVVVWAPEEVRA
jgi:uncharacterized protein YqjF (DUF2071 family)